MGIFSGTNPFDGVVEKITDAKNTSEDWGMIMDLCDRVQTTTSGSKECLKAVVKRLNHQDPHVVIQAITLLDACVNNCGKEFRLEVASREFETEFRKLLSKSHPKVQEKLRGLLKTWAEGEFKGDSQLGLIPGLYSALKREGVDFSSSSSDQAKKVAKLPKDPNVVSSQQEEDDIAKAIQLSLQESKGSPKKASSSSSSGQSSSLYPSNSLYASAPAATAISADSSPKGGKDEKKARALYDFEAAEDNELTFKAGEIVIIIDDSDANWWKGSNHRGEGLFPANFVTKDLAAEPEQFKEEKQRRRSVQFNEEVEVKTLLDDAPPAVAEISEDKIDTVMRLLHEADPTSPECDAAELPSLEDQVNSMGPLIDAELESVDRRHAQLTRLSTELVDALNLYHQLMHEPQQYAAPGAAYMPPHQMYGAPPQMQPPYIPPGPMMQQQPNGQPPMNMNYSPQQQQFGPPPSSISNGMPSLTGQMPETCGMPPVGHQLHQQPPMYTGTAPPPPTPPLAEQSPQHFTSPPVNHNPSPGGYAMNGTPPPMGMSAYPAPIPQLQQPPPQMN